MYAAPEKYKTPLGRVTMKLFIAADNDMENRLEQTSLLLFNPVPFPLRRIQRTSSPTLDVIARSIASCG
jgi:hypothetical protein